MFKVGDRIKYKKGIITWDTTQLKGLLIVVAVTYDDTGRQRVSYRQPNGEVTWDYNIHLEPFDSLPVPAPTSFTIDVSLTIDEAIAAAEVLSARLNRPVPIKASQ